MLTRQTVIPRRKDLTALHAALVAFAIVAAAFGLPGLYLLGHYHGRAYEALDEDAWREKVEVQVSGPVEVSCIHGHANRVQCFANAKPPEYSWETEWRQRMRMEPRCDAGGVPVYRLDLGDTDARWHCAPGAVISTTDASALTWDAGDRLHWHDYNGGTTKFRDVVITNGTSNRIQRFTGSPLVVDGNVTLGDSSVSD